MVTLEGIYTICKILQFEKDFTTIVFNEEGNVKEVIPELSKALAPID